MTPDCPSLFGIIDLVIDKTYAVVLIDFKTSATRWSATDAEIASEQLLVYGALAKELSVRPLELQFVVVTKTKVPSFEQHRVVMSETALQRTIESFGSPGAPSNLDTSIRHRRNFPAQAVRTGRHARLGWPKTVIQRGAELMPAYEHTVPATGPVANEHSPSNRPPQIPLDAFTVLVFLNLAVGGCGCFSTADSPNGTTEETSHEREGLPNHVQWHYKLGSEPLP